MAEHGTDRLLREALSSLPRWRLFGGGTATASFEFSEPIYAAAFVTRAIEQARSFNRIPDLSLSGNTVKLALVLALSRGGLSTPDRQLLEALERAANHPGRPAPTDVPILPLLADRWSPRSFSPEAVPVPVLMRLFEAARWAASSFNEQPWRYVVVTDPARKDEVSSVLVEGNAWARQAPVMVLVVISKKLSRNNRVNRHAAYDTGAATAQIMMQATALGLVGHQMAGFDARKARELFHVPEKFEPLAMMVLGYWGEGQALSEELQLQEEAARERKKHTKWLFWQDWEGPLPGSEA